MISILGWPAFLNRVQNPYNYLLYKAIQGTGASVREFSFGRAFLHHADVLHVHWPEMAFERHRQPMAALRAVALLLLLYFVRLRGTKVVWTAHNLRSHDHAHPRTEALFYHYFTRTIDGVVAVSDAGWDLAVSRFPSLRALPKAIVPLGHFSGYYTGTDTKAEARTKLGLPEDAFIFGSFGRVRAYKNLPALVHAFKLACGTRDLLVIAGAPSEGVTVSTQQSTRVRLDLRHVEEDCVRLYHVACDAIVLPYRDILNSASAMLALSCNRPLLVPDTPTMHELRGSVGKEWVHLFSHPLSPADLLTFKERVNSLSSDRAIDLSRYDWDRLAHETVDFFNRVCAVRT